MVVWLQRRPALWNLYAGLSPGRWLHGQAGLCAPATQSVGRIQCEPAGDHAGRRLGGSHLVGVCHSVRRGQDADAGGWESQVPGHLPLRAGAVQSLRLEEHLPRQLDAGGAGGSLQCRHFPGLRVCAGVVSAVERHLRMTQAVWWRLGALVCMLCTLLSTENECDRKMQTYSIIYFNAV